MKKTLFLAISSSALLACVTQTQEFPAEMQEDIANLSIAEGALLFCPNISQDKAGSENANARIAQSASRNNIPMETVRAHRNEVESLSNLMSVEKEIFGKFFMNAGITEGSREPAVFVNQYCGQLIKEDQQNTKIGQLIVVR